jgi:hypothetical protein
MCTTADVDKTLLALFGEAVQHLGPQGNINAFHSPAAASPATTAAATLASTAAAAAAKHGRGAGAAASTAAAGMIDGGHGGGMQPCCFRSCQALATPLPVSRKEAASMCSAWLAAAAASRGMQWRSALE